MTEFALILASSPDKYRETERTTLGTHSKVDDTSEGNKRVLHLNAERGLTFFAGIAFAAHAAPKVIQHLSVLIQELAQVAHVPCWDDIDFGKQRGTTCVANG